MPIAQKYTFIMGRSVTFCKKKGRNVHMKRHNLLLAVICSYSILFTLMACEKEVLVESQDPCEESFNNPESAPWMKNLVIQYLGFYTNRIKFSDPLQDIAIVTGYNNEVYYIFQENRPGRELMDIYQIFYDCLGNKIGEINLRDSSDPNNSPQAEDIARYGDILHFWPDLRTP